MCPPEGDAGTGMVATNSVRQRTGNVSAGTSVFAMLVLEKELSTRYPEIDMVTTPAGDSVAMVHSNNCTSDLNAWVGLFDEFAAAIGAKIDKTSCSLHCITKRWKETRTVEAFWLMDIFPENISRILRKAVRSLCGHRRVIFHWQTLCASTSIPRLEL